MDKQDFKDLIYELKYNKELRIELRNILNSNETFTKPKSNPDPGYPKMYMRDNWYGD